MDSLDRVTIASRVFCLSAVLGLSAIAGASAAITSTLIVAMLAAASAYVCVLTPRAALWTVAGETLLVVLVLGLGLPDSLILLPYLVVLGLIAGLAGGLVGVSAVMSVQSVAVVVLSFTSVELGSIRATTEVFGPWMLTGLGAGLLGAWLRQTGLSPRTTTADASYESARRLLTQLRTVARRLSAGLDPLSMSAQLLSVVHEHLDDTQSAVFVRTDGGVLVPLCHRGYGAKESLSATDPAVEECWTRMAPTQTITASGRADRRHWTVLPLRVGSRMIGVVVSASDSPPQTSTLTALMRELDEHSMRIDTAMAFEEVRAIATADERRRLAREIHDGIAQEIASLGYVVDELAETTSHPEQARRLRDLRGDLTRLVSELRLSIFDLRSETNPTSGLGAALSDYVRQVGSRSDMTVHLTLDESPTRLTSGVEAELFRIAQEAITNARKHSRGKNLWVDCRVRPPFARVKITDDGRGIRPGGDDSFGLRIMHERATRIDACLTVESQPVHDSAQGTAITVTLGAETGAEIVREERSR